MFFSIVLYLRALSRYFPNWWVGIAIGFSNLLCGGGEWEKAVLLLYFDYNRFMDIHYLNRYDNPV